MRTVSIGGPTLTNRWRTFVGNPAVRPGRHHFKATIGLGSISFALDLDSDGTIDGVRTLSTPSGGLARRDMLRIGGPTDMTSPNGGVGFDNVRLSIDELCPCDFNDADEITVQDMYELLSCWNAGCA